MVEDVTLYPPHPVMFVGDPEEESPDVDGASLINVAPAVISVGTLPDVDGPTTIRLADEEDLLRLPEHLAFDGQLMLPRQRLAVADSAVQVHLERKLAAQAVHIQVWVNDQQFPDDIVVRIMT